MNYRHYGEYVEQLQGPTGSYSMMVSDDRRIDGSGYDVKAGIIYRPVEYSPFRLGLSISTPTWYDLTTKNVTTVSDNLGASVSNSESYDYKLYTPWKFGLSA